MKTRHRIHVLSSYDWYSRLAPDYYKYHTHLTSFEQNKRLQFIPRNMENISIMDLWCWDWRIFPFIQQLPFATYHAVDICPAMLKHFFWWKTDKRINKITYDITSKRDNLPKNIDCICMFFVLEHMSQIQDIWSKLAESLAKNWRIIISYFPQIRQMTFGRGNDAYKINIYNWTLEDIKTALDEPTLSRYEEEVFNEWKQIWSLFVWQKKSPTH